MNSLLLCDFFDAEEIAQSLDKCAGDDFRPDQMRAMYTLLEKLSLRCTDILWLHGGIPPSFISLGKSLTGSNPLHYLRTLDLRFFRTNQHRLVDF